MQALQDHREDNDQLFQSIEKRWDVIDQAGRIEAKERREETEVLGCLLGSRNMAEQKLESSKAEIFSMQLSQLQGEAEECKEEIEKLFEKQDDFRSQHLQQKNLFLQTYSETSNSFNAQMQEYAQDKLTDVSNRLISVDSNTRIETANAVQQVRDSVTAFRETMKEERKRVEEAVGKASEEANRVVEELSKKVRENMKRRQESEAKLLLMVSNLSSQLWKLQEIEEKEGEVSYDCLLKLIEDACSHIQQAQLSKS